MRKPTRTPRTRAPRPARTSRQTRTALTEDRAIDRAAAAILDEVTVDDVRSMITPRRDDDLYDVILEAVDALLQDDPRCEPAAFAELAGLDEDALDALGVHDTLGVAELIIARHPDEVDPLINDVMTDLH